MGHELKDGEEEWEGPLPAWPIDGATSTDGQKLGVGDVGAFVRTAELGVGRLLEVDSHEVRVQYFQAPGASPYFDRNHPIEDVSTTTLAAHTRAYFHDGSQWRIGRVDGIHPQDPRKYLIALPNGKAAILPVESFDVRWDSPITNPFDVLASVGGDSPLVYEDRLNLLRAWSQQRAAALGVEGLVLGSVELHRHQLDVVRRIAADPIKRYLLADEVGLGKTIEAAALIWQYLADHPDGRVLVLAPNHIRDQWQQELLDRFRTDRYPNAWIRIWTHDLQPNRPDRPVGLLVIDEAHHVTRMGSLPPAARERIAQLAHSADELLLLSATPVRSNEAGFLDLLSLLDPDHYHPSQLDDFVRRVELRDTLALTYQALVPKIDKFDLSLYADELTRLFPEDEILRSLLMSATAAEEAVRPQAVARIREHLSETYRLHHRLLRTRRTVALGATFSVRGRKRAVPLTLEVNDSSDRLRHEFLDSLRIHLVAATEEGQINPEEAVDVFREAAQRCGSLSHALLPLSGPDHMDQHPAPVKAFHDLVERGMLPGWSALIGDIHSAHVDGLRDLGSVLSSVSVSRGLNRTIIASTFTETAQAVATEMTKRWGADRVATHLLSQARADNVAEVARWNGEGPCSLLICDAGAEEGINLQKADLLIHLDLPWESFRLEQRIGRCDRHSEDTSAPIPSMVVAYGDQPYALGWIEFLADGCDIFTRSVSSLQYVLADTERAIQHSVVAQGPHVLAESVEAQAETLDAELTRIIAHDALDSIDSSDLFGTSTANDALLTSDSLPTLTNALLSWLAGVGTKLRRPAPGTVRIDRKPRPQIPFSLEYAIRPYMEMAIAVERSAAVSRSLPILRSGHPMVEAVAAHLKDSDRGVTFALFRPGPPGQWPPVTVLRTDFLVAPSTTNTFVAEAETVGLGGWASQLIEEMIPPVIETVLMTIEGKEVSVAALLRPYDKQKEDRNLISRPDLFERLTAHLDWKSVCASALQHAHSLLSQRPSVAERPEAGAIAIRTKVIQRIDREHSRQLAGLRDADVDMRRLETAVPETIEQEIHVLGCGAIFLGDENRFW